MDEVSSDGVRLPGAAARLQPPRARSAIRSADPPDDLLHAAALQLADLEAGHGLDGQDREDLKAALDRLRRRGQDKELVDQLAVDGFTGPAYEIYRAELVAYALPILMSWLRTGTMFALSRLQGQPVREREDLRELLRVDRDERLELAGLVAAIALNEFRTRALVGQAWTPEGGASLKTYFIGCCINNFIRAYRMWFHGHKEATVRGYGSACDLPASTGVVCGGVDVNPAQVAVSTAFVRAELDRIDNDLTRELAGRVALLGDTHAEAGQALGLSEGAVGERFRRARREHHRRQANRNPRGGQPA